MKLHTQALLDLIPQTRIALLPLAEIVRRRHLNMWLVNRAHILEAIERKRKQQQTEKQP